MKIFDLVLFQTMGDVLMTTPIISEIKRQYPDVQIRFHTNKVYKGLLAGNPEINDIVLYDGGSYPDVYQYLRGKQSDHIARMARANHYDTMWHHTPETRNSHMIDWYASRTGLLTTPIKDKHIRFNIGDEARKNISPIIPNNTYAVIHTTSRVASKDWPIQHFTKLVSMIKKSMGIEVVQIGIGSDKRVPGTIDLCGKTVYQETAAVLERAKFYVGVDGGPSYLAESVNLPSVIVMGATMGCAQESGQKGPFVGPIGPSVRYVEPVRPKEAVCRPVPCFTHCQLNNPCNIAIIPEKVLEVIKETIHVD